MKHPLFILFNVGSCYRQSRLKKKLKFGLLKDTVSFNNIPLQYYIFSKDHKFLRHETNW